MGSPVITLELQVYIKNTDLPFYIENGELDSLVCVYLDHSLSYVHHLCKYVFFLVLLSYGCGYVIMSHPSVVSIYLEDLVFL